MKIDGTAVLVKLYMKFADEVFNILLISYVFSVSDLNLIHIGVIRNCCETNPHVEGNFPLQAS
jgi:hypothetical protein